MAVTDTGRLYFTDSFGNLGAKRFNPEGLHVHDAGDLWIAETSMGQSLRYDSVTLEIVGQSLGLPVVITSRGPGALLANSANSPAQLLGIDVLP